MKGFVISGTGSGVGKTSVTTGIMSLLSKKYKVQGFKVGPDFIDPMYHSIATGRACRNLDSFMMDDDRIRNLVGYASKDADLCIVEGVRGLYEGFSGDSDIGSTAYIAKLLDLPVILVVGSLTRSAAAVINGFRSFDPKVKIAGVILNKVSGSQHSEKLDIAMSAYCDGVGVVGKIRKDRDNALGQRHLGLNTILDKDKISYSIYTDYDEIFVFNPEEYPEFDEPTTNIYPYLLLYDDFNDHSTYHSTLNIEFWGPHFPNRTTQTDGFDGIDYSEESLHGFLIR